MERAPGIMPFMLGTPGIIPGIMPGIIPGMPLPIMCGFIPGIMPGMKLPAGMPIDAPPPAHPHDCYAPALGMYRASWRAGNSKPR